MFCLFLEWFLLKEIGINSDKLFLQVNTCLGKAFIPIYPNFFQSNFIYFTITFRVWPFFIFRMFTPFCRLCTLAPPMV